MLSDVTNLTVDDRGRITIPKKYSAVINKGVNLDNPPIEVIDHDKSDENKSSNIKVRKKNQNKKINFSKEDRKTVEDKASYGSLVVAINFFEPCLNIYPLHEWQKIKDKLDNLPSFSSKTDKFSRIFGANSSGKLDLDKNHRLLIPERFRNKVNLGSNPVLVGTLDKFQLWSYEEWQKVEVRDQQDIQDAKKFTAELESLGL